MENVLNGIKAYSDIEAVTYMTLVVGRLRDVRCMVCDGEGHTGKKCQTKKNIDKATKLPQLASFWGKVKSELKMEHMGVIHEVSLSLVSATVSETPNLNNKQVATVTGNGKGMDMQVEKL